MYANQSWGSYDNLTGTWSGSVGHLYNKTADLSICDLTRTYERSKAVDFSRAYLLIPLTFVSTRPGLKSRQWITLSPFAPMVWLSMTISFILSTVVLHLLYHKCVAMPTTSSDYDDDTLDTGAPPPPNKPKLLIDYISISLIAALLQQSNIRVPTSQPVILVYMCLWFLISLVLMKAYSAKFYSILTLPEHRDPIETLDDLERAAVSGQYDIITYAQSYYHDVFALADCCSGSYYHIGQNMLAVSRLPAPETADQGIDLINNYSGGGGGGPDDRGVIFVNTVVSLWFAVRSGAKRAMHISGETLMMDHMGMAFRKGSPLIQPIARFLENGLFEHWLIRTVNRVPARYHLDEQPVPSEAIRDLLLNDLQSIFYICLMGFIVAVILTAITSDILDTCFGKIYYFPSSALAVN
ncbi:glutamate receptor-like [Oppia nitens]|uniref:glutamate receptor-like n=1 Tax=Oppia nitens TaxID=1686743 RepID=UPI0023DAB71A|nr:glutamate receptor-like [Oppia nitens]